MDFSLYRPTQLELFVYKKYQDNGVYCASDMEIDRISAIFDMKVYFYDGKCTADWIDLDDGRYANALIILDNKLPDEEIRECFFHELGHPIYHVGDQDALPELFVRLQESQATNFQLAAAIPFYMLYQYIHEVTTTSALIAVLSKEFRLPLSFVKKRVEQIQNRIYLATLEKEWMELDTDTSNINDEYIEKRQQELGQLRQERYGV